MEWRRRRRGELFPLQIEKEGREAVGAEKAL
jgi:hypothetical protein